MSRVAIISFSPLNRDPRILKQLALLRGEHEVTTVGYEEAPIGVTRHIRVPDEFAIWQYPRLPVVLHRYRAAYEGNPAIAFVRERLHPGAYDAVVANDVDAAGLAVWAKPRHGFHLDLHEFAPEQNSEMWRFRAFVAPFLRWQLRSFAVRAASTTTVGPTIAERYRTEFGLDPGVVMNAAPLRDLKPHATTEIIRLVHVGAALPNRRLETMIVGAGDAARAGAPVTLDIHLIPNHPSYVSDLADLAEQYPSVALHPPVPHAELIATLARYDVGVHLLAPTNYNNAMALPNKLFDFVQARLGVVTGPSPEMARIVDAHDLGVVTADFTAASLAEALQTLTPASVDRFKWAAARAAPALSAESQQSVWSQSFQALLNGAV